MIQVSHLVRDMRVPLVDEKAQQGRQQKHPHRGQDYKPVQTPRFGRVVGFQRAEQLFSQSAPPDLGLHRQRCYHQHDGSQLEQLGQSGKCYFTDIHRYFRRYHRTGENKNQPDD